MALGKKRKPIIFILSLILFNLVIIGLFKERSFWRLALWNIMESKTFSDFYWHPDQPPKYFYFEPSSPKLDLFKDELSKLIKEKNSDLEKILSVANYVMGLGKEVSSFKRVIWNSPDNMLKQIKEGRKGNCFHYSIIFSTYLASIGFKARLWTLEGDDGLESFGHTVVEVYIKDLNKWVMFDVVNRIYFTEKEIPLSVLELRERLLNKNLKDLKIVGEISEEKKLFNLYSRLLKMVFLRTANDFLNKYSPMIRYRKLYYLEKFFDLFPQDIRRGLSYLIGRKEYLIHYLDEFNKSLKPKIILAKIIFYSFVVSLVSLVIFSFRKIL